MARSNWSFLAYFRGIKCQIPILNAAPTAGVKKNQKTQTILNYFEYKKSSN